MMSDVMVENLHTIYALGSVIVLILCPFFFVPWHLWDIQRRPVAGFLILFAYIFGRTMLLFFFIAACYNHLFGVVAWRSLFRFDWPEESVQMLWLFAKVAIFFTLASLAARYLWGDQEGQDTN